MNHYTELQKRQQQEVNALPLGFAFSNKQFAEMMEKWGLDPERDLDQICSIGFGGYIQKKDMDLMHETFARHRAEHAEAIKTDKEYIYQMFLHELDNHEYGYTCDPTDALAALGYTLEQVVTDKRLWKGFERACKEIMRRSQ